MSFNSTKNFWTNTTSPKDPKRNFRFRITLFGEIIWWAKDVTQPEASISEATHDFMMHKFYWPSKVTWNEVTMNLVDPVTPGTLDGLLLALQDSGYVIPSNPSDTSAFNSINKAVAAGVAGGGVGSGANGTGNNSANVMIEVIDAFGATLHKWTLNNAFIKKITPSQLSYTNEDLMSIALTLRYDWASYENPGNSSGTGNTAGAQAKGLAVGDSDVPADAVANGSGGTATLASGLFKS